MMEMLSDLSKASKEVKPNPNQLTASLRAVFVPASEGKMRHQQCQILTLVVSLVEVPFLM